MAQETSEPRAPSEVVYYNPIDPPPRGGQCESSWGGGWSRFWCRARPGLQVATEFLPRRDAGPAGGGGGEGCLGALLRMLLARGTLTVLRVSDLNVRVQPPLPGLWFCSFKELFRWSDCPVQVEDGLLSLLGPGASTWSPDDVGFKCDIATCTPTGSSCIFPLSDPAAGPEGAIF